MATAPLHSCRMCGQEVPPPLAKEVLCLDHYIEHTIARVQSALELCQKSQPVDAHLLDWLLGDADFAVQSLSQDNLAHSPAQRGKLLEVLLCLANLHEYLRHHSVQLKPTD